MNTFKLLAGAAVQTKRISIVISVSAAVSIGLSNSALAAGNNEGPPSGWIYNLAGQAVPHGLPPQAYSTSFTASLADTSISFAFREDPAYFFFSGVTVTNVTTGSTVNLISNGDFSGGTYVTAINSSVPNSWTFQNTFGAYAQGQVINGSDCGSASGYCWYDGSVQAYDAISQTILVEMGSMSLFMLKPRQCSRAFPSLPPWR
jgi:hypothetical protein